MLHKIISTIFLLKHENSGFRCFSNILQLLLDILLTYSLV